MSLSGPAGGQQTLSLTYTDSDGSGFISYGQAVVNAAGVAGVNGVGACYTGWDRNGNLYLGGSPQLPAGASGTVGQPSPGMTDEYCAVDALHSTITSSGNTMTVSLALTFTAGFAGGHEVYSFAYNTAGLASGWQDLGQLTTSGPTVLITDLTQNSGYFYVGDSFSVTFTGPPNQVVSVSSIANGGVPTSASFGSTTLQGVFSILGAWDMTSVGSYAQTWTVGGVQAGPTLIFTVFDPTPDPQPSAYPNYLNPPQPPPVACNITGIWADSLSTGTWSLTQPDNTITGSFSLTRPSCGSVTWSVSGTIASGVAALNANNPVPAIDLCGTPAGTNAASVVFSSCYTGQAAETATRPAYIDSFLQSIPAQTLSGTGIWTLTTPQVTFSVSPTPQIPMSTGDTNTAITTTASISTYAMSSVVYIKSPVPLNPASDCAVSLAISPGSGTGSASSTMTAAPAGCSGIFTVQAAAGGTLSSNITQVVIPPQVLLQVLYGEAHGQALTYGINDPTQQAVGITIRNRFGDNTYFRGSTTYQNTITTNQFFGIDSSITTGRTVQGMPTLELLNAVAVFGGSSNVSVANAKCFFSPGAADWSGIQVALASKTKVLPVIASQNDPHCFRESAQYIYKSSVSTNVNGSGAPSFIFVQKRAPADPAVITIP